MCIAILKPKNRQVKKATLKRCFESNPDGAGFMYAKDKKLYIEKGFMSFNAFYEKYTELDLSPHQTLIHFRIKTHGAISKDNCHPFIVSDRIGFIHNGIIDIDTKGNESDTMAFNREYLKRINDLDRCISNVGIQDLLSDRIGGSKLVFLDNLGRTNIINEDLGVWDRGIWYSNRSYKDSFSFNGYKYPTTYTIDAYEDSTGLYKCYDCGADLIDGFEIDNEICIDCIESDTFYSSLLKQSKSQTAYRI